MKLEEFKTTVDEIEEILVEIESLRGSEEILSENVKKKLQRMEQLLEQCRPCAQDIFLKELYIKAQLHVFVAWLNEVKEELKGVAGSPMRLLPEYRLIYTACDKNEYDMVIENIRHASSRLAKNKSGKGMTTKEQIAYDCPERVPIYFEHKGNPETHQITVTGDLIQARAVLGTGRGCYYVVSTGRNHIDEIVLNAESIKSSATIAERAAESMSKAFSSTPSSTSSADGKRSSSTSDPSKISEDLDEKQQTQIKKPSPVNGLPPTKK